MACFDKRMYEDLKSWYDGNAETSDIRYIHCKDRQPTDAAIRRLMYVIRKEDKCCEEYVSYFSAESFARKMRDYFTGIAGMYCRHVGEDEPIKGIIGQYPPDCGWLVLIVSDLDELSQQPDVLEEIFQVLNAFAKKGAYVILSGKGDYKKVFGACKDIAETIEAASRADLREHVLRFGLYEQEDRPKFELPKYEDEDEEREALCFYWQSCFDQLGNQYFDFEYFKTLYKDTWEYLIPRVTEDRVYRKDVDLIETVSKFRKPNETKIYGCRPWELDAAEQLAQGLNDALINEDERNGDFSSGTLNVATIIDNPREDHGVLRISGYMLSHQEFHPHDLAEKIDRLAEEIHQCTYLGKKSTAEIPALDGLMDEIKKAADETVNKEPEKKVRRAKEREENV